jgi:urease accessory protein
MWRATTSPADEQQALRDEIAALQRQLQETRSKQEGLSLIPPPTSSSKLFSQSTSLHTLLLLADSALPLGSFAFSSGLESFLAHKKLIGNEGKPQQVLFKAFLDLTLQSLASTALPYVLEAYRNPHRLDDLDNDFDASTPCTVARRASVAQGKALLNVWERSFKAQYLGNEVLPSAAEMDNPSSMAAVMKNVSLFSTSVRSRSDDVLSVNAHLAPLWGVVSFLMRVDLSSAAYLFVFCHARTIVSAAVRASVLGPYQAQAVLAAVDLQNKIEGLIQLYWKRKALDAGQSVPVVDLWVGGHEKLYSRIFNS